MTLNKTKIEWCGGGYTWNPFTGCDHPFNSPVLTNTGARACGYCYACNNAEIRFKGGKAFPNGFAPTFHPNRLNDPGTAKKPSIIFTVSMGDMFCPGCKPEWQDQIFDSMFTCNQQRQQRHMYIVLTKAPERIYPALYGKESGYRLGGGDYYNNICFGTTVDTAASVKRLDALRKFKEKSGGDWLLMASFEPLLEEMPSNLDLTGIDWVVIGQKTHPNNNPPKAWVLKIMGNAASNLIPVFIKNNLIGMFSEKTKTELQQYPAEIEKYVRC